jgi:hypothetical protein
MVKTIPYLANLAADTNLGPSQAIWGDCPILEFLEDPSKGRVSRLFARDLSGHPATSGGAYAGPVGGGGAAAYLYQGGSITDGAAEGGSAVLASDGDNEGAAVGAAVGGYQLYDGTNLQGKLWFEARVASSSVTATKHDAFVGLFDGFCASGVPQAAVPITTTDNTLADVNLIGFHKKGNAATDWSFVYKLAGTTIVYPTNLTTLAATVLGAALTAGQSVKLGFVFDPNGGSKVISSASTGQTAGQTKKALITVFINGLPAVAFLTSDNTGGGAFPTGVMGPGLAVMNQTGTTPGSLAAKWVQVAQRASS